jgi:co-chaperonin GroES (HSP10)
MTVEKVKDCRPLRDIVIIERLDEGNMSEGGIHIPDSAKEHRRISYVWKVGPDVDDFGEGDYVLTTLHKGVDLQWGERKCLLIGAQDVKVVVKPEYREELDRYFNGKKTSKKRE